MTTSGTNLFENPPISEILIESFERIGKNPAELTQQQWVSARRSLNLILTSKWSNSCPLLWKVTSQTYNLIQGVYQIPLPTNMVSLLDSYVSVPKGDGTYNDYILYSMSRSEYVAQPNKLTQSRPTSIWVDKTTTPTAYLWQVPDQSNYYTFTIWYMAGMQDADMASGQTSDVHFLFLEALCAELAASLAVKFAPDRFPLLKPIAVEAFKEATDQNRESAPLIVAPQIGSFYGGS